MKKAFKRLMAVLFVKFLDNNDKEIAKAKKIAEKARTTLHQAREEADKAEAKFDDVVHNMNQELMKLNEKYGNVIDQRNAHKNDLRYIQKLSDELGDNK